MNAIARRRESPDLGEVVGRVVDALEPLEAGVALYARPGELLHRNRCMDGLLAAAEGLAYAVRRLVHDLAEGPAERIERREKVGADIVFELRGSRIGLPDRGSVLLVSARRPAFSVRSHSEVQQAFHLTATQSRVALLLAEGCSNAEIARALGVSEHTVHSHTRAVLQRLGLSRRAQVGPLLQRKDHPNG